MEQLQSKSSQNNFHGSGHTLDLPKYETNMTQPGVNLTILSDGVHLTVIADGDGHVATKINIKHP